MFQSKHDCYYKKETKHFRKRPYIDIIATCNHSCCHRHIVYKYYAIKDGHNTGKNHADFFQLFIDPLR